MDGIVVRLTLSLIGPGIMLVFGLAFAGVWRVDRRRPYLLLLTLTCLLFAAGSIAQILYWPFETGRNAMVSGALYTAAVLLAAQAILLRSGRPFSWALCAALFFLILFLTAYFFYIDRNLLARVYIQNFGYGFILLAAAMRLRSLPRRRHVDRILFWVLLAFALHFFPRTLLTMGFSAPVGERAFANSAFWQALQLSIAVFGVALSLTIIAAAFSDLLEDLRKERDTDGLTGILNRRGFEEAVTARLAKPEEGGSLILCDIDRFKRVNDVHGHDIGDAVLRALGQLLRDGARNGDVVGRFGGEEFLLFLPGTDLRMAQECAERLRIAMATTAFAFLPAGERITASFGVAQRAPGERWADLLKRTDTCLYVAKNGGRNRSVAAQDPN